MPEPLLAVENLTTRFETAAGPLTAADGVSFSIGIGETLGLVGESGSGKSVTAFSLLRLVQPPGRIVGGRVVFQGRDLLSLAEDEIREVRGAGIGFVFQEPMAALNPVMRVGAHIAEALRVHGLATRGEARARAIDLLRGDPVAVLIAQDVLEQDADRVRQPIGHAVQGRDPIRVERCDELIGGGLRHAPASPPGRRGRRRCCGVPRARRTARTAAGRGGA